MQLEIRKARQRDLPKIVDYYGPIGESPLDPFSDIRRLRKLNLKWLLIAEQDGEFAGFLYYFAHRQPWFDPSIRRYASIDELHVLPEFRRRGVATKLLQKALDEIKRLGVNFAYVDTDEDNLSARALYRKAGFKEFKRRLKLKLLLSTKQRPRREVM